MALYMYLHACMYHHPCMYHHQCNKHHAVLSVDMYVHCSCVYAIGIQIDTMNSGCMFHTVLVEIIEQL